MTETHCYIRDLGLIPGILPNDRVSPLVLAAIEATEEAIYNSLCMATSMTGHNRVHIQALPLETIRSLLQNRIYT
jgi:D-aminopeptidase